MSACGSGRPTDPDPPIRQALQRPVLSPDGNFIAVITPGFEIHIITLAQAFPGSRVTKKIILPKAARSFITQCYILKWSPETVLPSSFDNSAINTTSEGQSSTTWLILSDGDRVIAICTELRRYEIAECGGLKIKPEEEASKIVADFDVGKQHGKITLLDFVFSHRHILILFEMCTQASIISLTKLQRTDVLLPKFPDERSFSQSPQNRYFALLTRSKGQDQISVFSPSDDALDKAQTFNTHTLDAQCIQWCPDGDPLLAVSDSASYGFKIMFFTALGHHLRHLDLTSANLDHEIGFSSSGTLGVLNFELTCRSSKTILTVAGPQHAFVYEQQSKARAPMLLAYFNHPYMIETTIYPVWQESLTSERNFSRLHTAFEILPSDSLSGVETVAVNADCSMVATKDSNRPRTIWIWPISSKVPRTIINFREHVKQILWHPSLPDVLLVLTSQKESTLYIWHDECRAPAIGVILSSASSKGAARFEGSWLPSKISTGNLFMMSSPEAFDIGSLDHNSDRVFFHSVL